ncbi:MAG: hypothetical protein Q4F83_14675 [Eubacteriales bacterium]|nr:hypothetical protein [Eubacteriales bacterium]
MSCTSEMLGVCNDAGIRQLAGRFVSQKREAKTSSDILYSNFFSLEDGKFSTGSEVFQFYNHYRNELVVYYIHESDGKKRIEI